MFKHSFSLITLSALSVTLFTSCDKEVKVKTKTELITQSSWKFDKATAVGLGDISSQVPACIKDNIYVFASNGTGSINESANICAPSTAGNFTWSLQSNETMLQLSAALFPGGSSDFTLISLTETNLVISQMMTLPSTPPLPPLTVNVEITLKH